MKNIFFFFLILVFISACGDQKKHSTNNIEIYTTTAQQDSVYKHLVEIINPNVSIKESQDSLVFLILPVHASCPACRDKTIDSILKHKDTLLKGRFIIISANGGRKTISSYFRERGSEIPRMQRLYLDTTNQSYKYDLYEKNPSIYYVYNNKAYKRITTTPSTIKKDLYYFFSGY